MQAFLTHDGDKIQVTRSSDLAQFPMATLVENYNSIKTETPVKKFTDRKTAEKRVWALLQETYGTAAKAEPVTPKVEKAPKVAKEKAPKVAKEKVERKPRVKSFNLPPKDEQRLPAETSKRGKLIRMMLERGGMTYQQVQDEIGWNAKDAYEGIRLVQVSCGYGMRQDEATGIITLYDNESWKALMADRKR